MVCQGVRPGSLERSEEEEGRPGPGSKQEEELRRLLDGDGSVRQETEREAARRRRGDKIRTKTRRKDLPLAISLNVRPAGTMRRAGKSGVYNKQGAGRSVARSFVRSFVHALLAGHYG